MSMEVPPVFQEAPRCDICSCSFSAFRRRHHCRSCGRTLCNDHSSNQMALPQFGIYNDVRVCDDCFNNPSRSRRGDGQTSDVSGAITDKFSRVSMIENLSTKTQANKGEPVPNVSNCKCGMPLCICEAPIPIPVLLQSSTVSTAQPNSIPKQAISTQQRAESTPRKQFSTNNKSTFFNHTQANNVVLNKAPAYYHVSGEGLRDAIKSGDVNAVRKLLSEGVDANYCDKQGLSLLHLAALFNQTEIALFLMDYGANAQRKNAQGETPLDCAPIMLQNKMCKKMEERGVVEQSDDEFVK